MGRVSQIPGIEAKVGKPIHKYLKEAIESGKKAPELAEEMGIGVSTCYRFIESFNLTDALREATHKTIYGGGGGELKDIIDEYLRAKEIGELSSKTISNYRDVLYAFLKWLVDNNKPTTLVIFESPTYIRDYFYYLKNEAERYGKPFTSSTRKAHHRVLKAFGFWLEREEKIGERKNPLLRVESPKVEERDPEDLPNEVIEGILDSFDDSFEGIRNHTIIGMFLETGMRLDEVAQLLSNQFDLDEGWAKIIGKGNKQRVIKIPPKMLSQLKEYLELRNPQAKTDKLWINYDGTVFQRDSIRKMCSALSDKFPGYRIHPHLFRHIWARFMAESNVNILAIAKMGGWKDIKLVQHYSSAMSAEKAWKAYEQATPLSRLGK